MDKTSVLDHIRIVLCRPSHTGNIGSAARAMKTMGLTRLVLVAPQRPIDEQAIALASGASDVLENAHVCTSLEEALHGVSIAAALTSRRRELASPLYSPRAAVAEFLPLAHQQQDIALVFGNETFGLSIEEVSACNMLITIAGNPAYFSLNLAQAVQVLSYEIFQQHNDNLDALRPTVEFATRDEVYGFYRHLERALNQIGFFQRRPADRLMRRLVSLFDRARLRREEVDILRGMCKKIEQLAPPSSRESE